MHLSVSEQATLNFYEWECLGRGYFHFENRIEMEPPFRPFQLKSFNPKFFIDDGKEPSIFKTVFSLVDSDVEVPFEEVEPEELITPNVVSTDAKLVSFVIDFRKGQEISSEISEELLNILSYSDAPISFEMLGTSGSITIQFVCSEYDYSRVQSHFKAYFPSVIFEQRNAYNLDFDLDKQVAICDFGLSEEFMRPIQSKSSFAIDPLTSIVASFDNLQDGDSVLLQVIFQGVTAPWARSILNSVSDGQGGSFFSDAPEMLNCAQEKSSSPLFSSIMRIGVQGITDIRSRYLINELTRSITRASTSPFNKLIPLSNEGYDYANHLYNVYHRTTNRLGMLLNSAELSTFVHYPNKTVVSSKLGLQGTRTKSLPSQFIHQKYTLGISIHNGTENKVSVNNEDRLKHTHIMGATGVGKSTLIANMISEDIQVGNGCALFDPHGDIVEDILKRIPENRKDDVLLIDPSDIEYPLGFNLLEAHSEAEKIILSSDLVASFKRYATAWGDNMTAVLQNAINTILDSTRGGTLIELKRFLIEEKFRKDFLKSVEDPSLHYYWQHEYPMVRKGIAPLLTRIDTFLRPKIIRCMLAQKSGIDFKACMEENKIVLVKLSQGLIGEENSFLLGSLFLAKFNQVAMSRQSISKEKRKPYFLFLDEFQNFITPSINNILSGARKYGIGLTLAHQELSQIDDTKLLNSVLSNPNIRICFRLGDADARKLETGFSYFEATDLMALSRGEAIMRIGNSTNDFNLKTSRLQAIEDNSVALAIKGLTREKYATPRAEVEAILSSMLPIPKIASAKKEIFKAENIKQTEKEENSTNDIASTPSKISEEEREKLIESENESREVRTHVYLQSTIKKLGQDRNYRATVEYPTSDGGRIDIVLERDGLKIGFEISETNKPSYEVKNIKKCLKAGCIPVVMVSKSKKHLNTIEQFASKELSTKDKNLVLFVQPNEIAGILDDFTAPPNKNEEVVKGFRVVTEFDAEENTKTQNIKSRLARLFKPKK